MKKACVSNNQSLASKNGGRVSPRVVINSENSIFFLPPEPNISSFPMVFNLGR